MKGQYTPTQLIIALIITGTAAIFVLVYFTGGIGGFGDFLTGNQNALAGDFDNDKKSDKLDLSPCYPGEATTEVKGSAVEQYLIGPAIVDSGEPYCDTNLGEGYEVEVAEDLAGTYVCILTIDSCTALLEESYG